MVIAISMLACTEPPPRQRPPDDTPTDGLPTDTDPVTDGNPDSETADTGPTTTVPTADTAPGYDCSVLPTIPVTWNNLTQFRTSEDFDIDGDGYMCSNVDGALKCKDMAGNIKTITVGMPGVTAGIRITADGDWLYNDVSNGALVKVDPATGAKEFLATGINYPNGLEVGRDGYAFIGENGSDKVRQIDIDTGDQYIAAEGLSAPNGVILSPDEQTMYVGSFGGGVIYAIDRISETTWDAPRLLFDPPPGDGGFDGINVDICGNVYITEFIFGRVWRLTDPFTEEGNGITADLPEGWIPNMRWGHDIGGWSSEVLYVTAFGSIYALDMGVPGKKHILIP